MTPPYFPAVNTFSDFDRIHRSNYQESKHTIYHYITNKNKSTTKVQIIKANRKKAKKKQKTNICERWHQISKWQKETVKDCLGKFCEWIKTHHLKMNEEKQIRWIQMMLTYAPCEKAPQRKQRQQNKKYHEIENTELHRSFAILKGCHFRINFLPTTIRLN